MSEVPTEHNITGAWNAVESTRLQGRKILVVLGAGASVAAGVPRMWELFKDLRERVDALCDSNHKIWADLHLDEHTGAKQRLITLRTKLAALENDHAPRSDASFALGSLQRAGERIRLSRVDFYLHELWLDFTNAFIGGRIGRPLPHAPIPLSALKATEMHKLCARWTAERAAYVVSLNFDGLTFCALREEANARPGSVGVVISRPDEVQRFFTGEIVEGPAKQRGLMPVIKVWGDVFHAVCKNPQCPQHDAKIPAFNLNQTQDISLNSNYSDSHIQQSAAGDEHMPQEQTGEPRNLCPICRAPRQLQIFFTGYDEKEKLTNELMRELLRFVAPEIGLILTVGFSGLWDRALVDFLSLLAADLQREDRNRKGLGEEWKPTPVWVNVDNNSAPPLHQEVAAHGITPSHLLHVCVKADEFAMALASRIPGELASFDSGYNGEPLDEGFWQTLVDTRTVGGKTLKPLPGCYDAFQDRKYLNKFGRLRQLGVKTCISATKGLSEGGDEKNHNRLKHSTGAAHVATYWFRHLAENAKALGFINEREEEWLASTVLFAAFHHDIGHIPFSHLAEEVFAEVRWTLEDWGDPFRHDEPVLASCARDFREQIFRATEEVFSKAKKPKNITAAYFRSQIESAIQGRSGRHWVDAILNSPLDADKLDYVFRDCKFLRKH